MQIWNILLHYLQNWQYCVAFSHGNLALFDVIIARQHAIMQGAILLWQVHPSVCL